MGLPPPLQSQQLRADFWECSTEVADLKVIEQDVLRTRAEHAFFRGARVRRLLLQVLLRYCGYYQVRYMQGLNEIVAVLLYLFFGKQESAEGAGEGEGDEEEEDDGAAAQEPLDLDIDIGSLHLSCLLFERIVKRLAPVLFASEGVQALQAQLAAFHLLLYFFDAQLAGYLSREGMTTDVYAQSWFITLFARRAPIGLVLHIWDLFLTGNKPHIIIFLGVALLLHNRAHLLEVPKELVPETLVRIHFSSELEIDALYARALDLEARTPPSAVREIIRVGFDASLPEQDRAPGLYELMYMPCMTMSAVDVATALMDESLACASGDSSRGSIDRPPPASGLPGFANMRYLIIECRADDDENSCAIQGSVQIRTSEVDEICRVVDSELSSASASSLPGPGSPGYPEVRVRVRGRLSPPCQALVSFLWSCRGDDVYIVLCGSDAGNGVNGTSASRRAGSPAVVGGGAGGTGSSRSGKTLSSDPSSATLAAKAQKREEAKIAYLLPTNQLAMALLMLGLSHVCVVCGANLAEPNMKVLPPQLQSLRGPLGSKTDGHAALVYELMLRGAVVGSGPTVHIPQDLELSAKVGAFVTRQSDERADKILRQKSADAPPAQVSSSTFASLIHSVLLPHMTKTIDRLTSLVTSKPIPAPNPNHNHNPNPNPDPNPNPNPNPDPNPQPLL